MSMCYKVIMLQNANTICFKILMQKKMLQTITNLLASKIVKTSGLNRMWDGVRWKSVWLDVLDNCKFLTTQLTCTCSKWTIQTLEKSVKYVQS